MNQWLVSVSIGPVQEFIAAARRTRDLWFGSYVLSELAKAAAKQAYDSGADMIFPYPQHPQSDLNPESALQVANKILFVCSEPTKPVALVKEMREELEKALQDTCITSISNARSKGVKNIDEPLAKRQLTGFIEFFAAWTVLSEAQPYNAARHRVESLLGARKTLRDFAAYEGTPTEKSTIDGIRENVVLDPGTVAKRMLKESERLDAVGLVKRFGGSQPPFESTSDVAAVPFVRYALSIADNKNEVKQVVERYRAFVGDKLEYRLGLSHNSAKGTGFGRASLALLTENESRQDELSESQRDELSKVRQELFRSLDVKGVTPYYVLLLADGDHMGQVLDTLGSLGQKRHQDFSKSLCDFAANCRQIIERRNPGPVGWGNLVYSGGDDVLALLPVDTALATARALRDEFSQSMRGIVGEVNISPTLSVGMVIAHALDDLAAVRRAADTALHDIAKERCNRNALAITSMPRSGEPVSVGGKWDTFDIGLRKIIGCYESGQVPFGLGYDWRRLADLCRRTGVQDDVVKKLAISILKQKGASARSSLGDRAAVIHDAEGLVQLANELVVARQIFQCSYFDSPPPVTAGEAVA